MISVCFRQDWDPLIVIVDSSEKFLCSTRADAFKEDKAGGRPDAEAFMIKLATDFCHNAVGLLGEPIDVNNLREEKKKRILAAGLPTKLPSNRNTKKTSGKKGNVRGVHRRKSRRLVAVPLPVAPSPRQPVVAPPLQPVVAPTFRSKRLRPQRNRNGL